MHPKIIVYRDDVGEMVSDDWGPSMKFRLVYYGAIRPDKSGMAIKEHKQAIRRRFHKQLRELWRRHDALLAEMTMSGFQNVVRPEQLDRISGAGGPVVIEGPIISINSGRGLPKYQLFDLVQMTYSQKCLNNNGYVWVPLVLQSYEVAVELEILLLFADSKPGPLEFGDVDSRVKTLVDALRQPDPQNIVGTPSTGEDPFCVLMQDDKLVTKLSVETDQLYRPQLIKRSKPEDCLIHATITVTLRPYRVSMFNLRFA